MPNHVKNIAKFKDISNARFEEILKEINRSGKEIQGIEDDEFIFDFNTIIPMPKSLDIEDSSRGDIGYACYRAYLNDIKSKMKKSEKEEIKKKLMKEYNTDDDGFELGKTYYENVKNYGAKSWYQWSIDHWGTKWNSMESRVPDDGVISFETAWSTPENVIKEMAKKFNVGIEVNFADEDIGSNCGTYEYDKNGDLINEVDMSYHRIGEKRSQEFACEIWDEEYESEMEG